LLLVLGIILASFIVDAAPAVPTLISYQGKLANQTNGNPFTLVSIRINITNRSNFNQVVWNQTFNNAVDSQGVFSLVLGRSVPLNLVPGRDYNIIAIFDLNSATFATSDLIFGDKNPASDEIIFNSGGPSNAGELVTTDNTTTVQYKLDYLQNKSNMWKDDGDVLSPNSGYAVGVNASKFCFGSSCITKWSDVNMTESWTIHVVNKTSLVYAIKILWSNLVGVPSFLTTNTWNRTGTSVILANTRDKVGIGENATKSKLSIKSELFTQLAGATFTILSGTRNMSTSIDVSGIVSVGDAFKIDGGGNSEVFIAYQISSNEINVSHDAINSFTAANGYSAKGTALTVTEGAVLFNGTLNGPGVVPHQGKGVKLMWIPSKASFREGMVENGQWNDDRMGYYSFSVGQNTVASGDYSSALGYNSTATGDYSFAVGNEVNASGDYAMGFGNHNTASGLSATAFGVNTKSTGNNSMTFGVNNIASGIGAIALGVDSNATGDMSAALGANSVSSGVGAIAIGYDVVSDGGISISMGAGTTSSGTASVALGYYTTSAGEASLSSGKFTTAVGDYSTSTGYLTTAYGEGSFSTGKFTKATGAASVSMGNYTTASGIYSLAGGYKSTASGEYSMAIGDHVNASGSSAVALGEYTLAKGGYSTALGSETKALGGYSTAMGALTTASGGTSTAMGYQTTASGESSTALGSQTNASGSYSTAMGYNTTASGIASTAMGRNIICAKDNATCIGGNVGIGTGTPDQKLKVEGNANVTGNITANSFCYQNGTCLKEVSLEGYVPYTGATQKVELNGNSLYNFTNLVSASSTADGANAISIGSGTYAQWYSIAAGNLANASGSSSISMGYSTRSTGTGSTSMGYSSWALARYATAIGYGTIASSDASTALGYVTTASGLYSTALGKQTQATGESSTAMGWGSIASGNYSTAMGVSTTASGKYSTAIGNYAKAKQNGAFAISDSQLTDFNVNKINQFGARFAGGYNLTGGNVTLQKGILVGEGIKLGGVYKTAWPSSAGPWNSSGTNVYLNNTNANVGIGTTTPDQKLKVVGNVNITGTIYYGGNLTGYGADFAERFTMSEKVSAGDVVCLNDEMKIIKCISHAQSSVVGVVSTAPTIIGNGNAPDSVPVGLVGVVPTKVKGPVARFDLLTTSEKPGYAEKATKDDFGSIIGKAMESCAADECTIKVLITLK